MNGYSNWFLLFKNELNEMYLQINVIGWLTSEKYWIPSGNLGQRVTQWFSVDEKSILEEFLVVLEPANIFSFAI